MGDELKADRTATGLGPAQTPSVRPGSEIALHGSTHRVDPSHAEPPEIEPEEIADGSRSDAHSNTLASAPVHAQPRSSVPARPSNRETDLLLQASQIAEHLRCQFAELDRREQTLNEQLALLDRERRSSRLWLQQSDEEIQDRQLRLKLQESELVERMEAIERIAGELEDKEQELAERRDRVDGDRVTMKESLSRELAAERNSLHRAQQMLQTERELLSAQREQQRVEHEAALVDLQDRVEVERENLRSEVRAEIEAERTELDSHQAIWLAQREAELLEIAREREITDVACRQTEGELSSLREKERREFEIWTAAQLADFEQKRQRHERSMRDEREAFERELAARQQEWIMRRDAERTHLECERESCEAAIEQSKSELESLQQDQLEALRRDREDHDCRLLEERRQFEADREQQLVEVKRERTLLDNRVRFQQEHLEKLRSEIEEAQREFRTEQQQARLREEEIANQQRLRGSQFDHYRATLEAREASLAREQQLNSGMKQNLETELHQERQRLDEERVAWEREREAQRAEIRRQQNMLTLHAENLEGRRSRLDQLRTELETTHRETLEMRMAVEEAWAQFAQEAGLGSATERFDAARAALIEHFGQVREALARQHLELTEAQGLFERERDEFRQERQNLTDWIAARDEQLRLWEQRLAQQAASLVSHESAERGVRDDWAREKSKAEKIIRDLLTQVADLTAPERSPKATIRNHGGLQSTEDERPNGDRD